MSDSEVISIIAVLKAKPGKIDALKQALQNLLLPTRREPGNIEYALFQLRDTPDVFYVRESWRGQASLDEHITLPHFQAFILQMNDLLAEPLRLDYLTPIAPENNCRSLPTARGGLHQSCLTDFDISAMMPAHK